MPTAKQVRDTIFQVRPEWKSLQRISVRQGTEIKLMIGLLDSTTIKTFDKHGTLKQNAKKIAKLLDCTVSDVYRIDRYEVVYLTPKQ